MSGVNYQCSKAVELIGLLPHAKNLHEKSENPYFARPCIMSDEVWPLQRDAGLGATSHMPDLTR